MNGVPVLFFIPTLDSGGAERVCVSYVNSLTQLTPTLLVQVKRGPLLGLLQLGIPVHELGAPFHAATRRASRSLAARVWRKGLAVASKVPFLPETVFVIRHARALAKHARELDSPVVASFITAPNIIAVLAKVLFHRKLRVVVNVHDVTSQILVHTRLKRANRALLRWLVRCLYPRADAVVAVASGVREDLATSFGIPRARIVVIHNPVDIASLRERAAEGVSHPWFEAHEGSLLVAVGRLTKLKGFHHLIETMAHLPPAVRLAIVGGGDEHSALAQKVVELGLTDRVVLLGHQDNPWKYMARADLFVLSSLTEGWPNVIGEAMALGLPVLATDCAPGVREFLQNGRCGLLVPPGDPRALAEGIARLLEDAPLRRELAEHGAERAAQFDLPKVVRTYEDLLLRLAHPDAHR